MSVMPLSAIATIFQSPLPRITLSNAYQLVPRVLASCTRVGALAWSPDDTLLAVATDATITLYNTRSAHVPPSVLTGHTDYIADLTFSPDGSQIVSASHDMTVRLWDVRTHQQLACLSEHTSLVTGVIFHPNGQWIASVGSWDQSVRIWDVQHSQLLVCAQADTDSAGTITVSVDGHYLATAGNDGFIRVWTYPYRDAPVMLKGSATTVADLAFGPTDATLAAVDIDATCYIWAAPDRKYLPRVYPLHDDGLRACYHPDGSFLAIGMLGGDICMLKPDNGETSGDIRHPSRCVVGLAFNHAGTCLASGE